MTVEALECIREAEQLFFVVTNRPTEVWLRRLNPRAITLDDCYAEGKSRATTYRQMSARILDAVRSGKRVCVAFYGHPGVFAQATHRAIRQARREGYEARMQPGISAEDCLFADLGINPGDGGCQSFEATEFLLLRRRFDPTSNLILWQVGVLGERSVRKNMSSRPERLRTLVKTLRRTYPRNHRVMIYEASTLPVCEPIITRVTLEKLSRETVTPMATLYVPPLPIRGYDRAIARWFDEK
jgi:uncharacterized protein YabN with tetrapyrrole methylase and pyrophosphatase domain